MHSCNTCSVQFTNFESQKAHMKTDWHRYNCKRKSESLSGISFKEFSDKVASVVPIAAPQKEHTKKIIKQEPIKEITERDCLFCTRSFKNETDNLTHMINDHHFFIPDYEYLVDLKGFLKYLGLKISNYYICLYCNGSGKSFYSTISTRHHMVSKGHCKIRYESEDDFEEYQDFYDFSESSVDSEPLMDGPIISEDNTELILPTGARVGHRSLQVYYRQSLRTTKPGIKIRMTKEQREAIDYAHKSNKTLMRDHVNYRLVMGMKNNNQKHHRSTLGYST